MRKSYYLALFTVLALLLAGCSGAPTVPALQEESVEAKQLLQGIWSDEDTEAIAFRMKGDSVFYTESTSLPAYFKVVGDTLYIGDNIHYVIEKHTAHVLWFKNQQGELMKFVKITKEEDLESSGFTETPTVLSLTEVLKRDTVINYHGERYHAYVAINPTKYKVVRHTINDDGLDVENIYYDNIIHLSIFRGSVSIFSRDFRKQFYNQKVPEQFITQAILNDMQYERADAQGFHFFSSLCVPEEASCYQVEVVVDFDGKLTTKMVE